MLVTSIFSLSNNVFKRLLSQDHLESALCCKRLTPFTLFHTIPSFNNAEEEGLRKQGGKRRKCWYQLLFLSFTMFSILSKIGTIIYTEFTCCQQILLTHYHTMLHFNTFQICSCGKHDKKRRKCL